MSKTEFALAIATKAKRKALADQITALAATFGATVTERDGERLALALGPYCVSMDFDFPKVGAFLGHWFTSLDSDVTYPRNFASTINGSANTYHWRKATTCETTLQGFLDSLSRGFAALAALPDAIAA